MNFIKKLLGFGQASAKVKEVMPIDKSFWEMHHNAKDHYWLTVKVKNKL